jgi:hypothetical protein
MHASLLPLTQAIRQQCRSSSEDFSPYTVVFTVVRDLMGAADVALCHARMLMAEELQITAVNTILRMMQQLHRCIAPLPAAAAGTYADGSSSSSSSSMLKSYANVQHALLIVYYSLQGLLHRNQLAAIVAEQVKQLLLDQEVQDLLLEPLVAHVTVLHQQHEAQHQQQQQQQQQPRARALQHNLAIPAFHQDMLLPGGQAYVDAVVAEMAETARSHRNNVQCSHVGRAYKAVAVHRNTLAVWVTSRTLQQHYDSVMLSAAAVRLVLELQLLAAEELRRQQKQQQQRRQRQQQQAEEQRRLAQHAALALLSDCNYLLWSQTQAGMHRTNGSCLPPEVLQQAGLQLLQALAAPVQQVQLLSQQGGSSEELSSMFNSPQQLYALRVAAEGAAVEAADAACK